MIANDEKTPAPTDNLKADATAAAPAAERIPSEAEKLVDLWFAKHFHDLGPKLSTELHNILFAAKEDLKLALHVFSKL